MRKITFSYLGILVLASFFSIFNSCTDKSTEKIGLSLTKKLHIIEKNIEKNIVIPNSVTPYDLNNQIFFKNLSKILILKRNEKEKMGLTKNVLDTQINNALKKYKNNLSLYIFNKSENKKITVEEELVFTSYFKIFNTSSLNKIGITNYYISQIPNLKLSLEDQQFSLNTLSFIKQLLVFINYDNNGTLNDKIADFDSCFDECMRGKADAVFRDGNWIDKAAFISTAAETTAWWIASCAWNCG